MLSEKLFSAEHLRRSWDIVRNKNSRACGTDGVAITDFDSGELDTLLSELQTGVFTFRPVRGYVSREGKKERRIGIFSVRDRIVQQALHLGLTPLFEPFFSEASYAYRPGRSALCAVERIENLIGEGYQWILETDIKDFFEKIDHDCLTKVISERVNDKRIMQIIHDYLNTEIFLEMKFINNGKKGICQGGILSPLLANIYLNCLDHAMERFHYVRYADDFLVVGRDRQELDSAFSVIVKYLTDIKLEVKKEKTRICHVGEGFEFLGFYFNQEGRGPAKKSMDALRTNLNKSCEGELEQFLAASETILAGWQNYYGEFDWLVPDNLTVLLACVQFARKTGNRLWLKRLEGSRNKINECNPDISLLLVQEWLSLNLTETALYECSFLFPSNGGNANELLLLKELLPEKKDLITKMIRVIALVVAEPHAEGYFELSEIYLAAGMYQLAQNAHEKAVSLNREESSNLPESIFCAKINLTENEIGHYMDLFVGRDDIYACELLSEGGERTFSTIRRPLTCHDIKQHINGDIILATYLVRENHTVRQLVIDIDVSKKLLLEQNDNQERLNRLISLTQNDANRIKSVAAGMDISIYNEDSGYKGRHCWFLFEEPVKAEDARTLAKLIIEKAGVPSAGINLEIFPASDRAKGSPPWNLMKLPLGRHSRTKRVSVFVDELGIPYEDQVAFITEIERISKKTLENQLFINQKKNEQSNVKINEILGKQPVLLSGYEHNLPERVTGKCPLLKYLLLKAEETNYLTHQERLTLLYVYGHLGEEGKQFLHKIIANCINYSHGRTQSYINRLLGSPISCNRLRDKHKEITASLGCNCRFQLTSGSYPSPVLHGLSPGKKSTVIIPENAAETNAEENENMAGIKEILQKMQNLRKHQRGINRSLMKYEQQLAVIFKQLNTNRLEIDEGTLVMVKEENQVKWIIEI